MDGSIDDLRAPLRTFSRFSFAERGPKLAFMIGVTGATGLVGRHLLRSLREGGIETAAFTRDPSRAPSELRGTARPWPPQPDDVAMDAIVNLQGESVGGRWSKKKKEAIRASRVEGTRKLVDAIGALPAERRPRVLVSASAIGFYGDRGETILDESASAGSDFLGEVCAAWEREAERAESHGVRVVRLRIGLVMSKTGGALEQMLPLFKLGLGGTMGPGDQWWPWIHLDDLIGIVRHAIDHDDARGPINATAPAPVRQRDFAKTLAKVLSRPAFLPAPTFALRTALGEFADELLSSRRVMPTKATELGYRFAHPELEGCLRDVT